MRIRCQNQSFTSPRNTLDTTVPGLGLAGGKGAGKSWTLGRARSAGDINSRYTPQSRMLFFVRVMHHETGWAHTCR